MPDRPVNSDALRETLELLRDARLQPHSLPAFFAERLKAAAGEVNLPLADLEILAAVHLFPKKRLTEIADLLRTQPEAIEDCLGWLTKHAELLDEARDDTSQGRWVLTEKGEDVLGDFQNRGEARAFTQWVAAQNRRGTLRQRARPRNRRDDIPAPPAFRDSLS